MVSAWQSVLGYVGNGNTQYNNVFGPTAAPNNGNLLTHADGAPQRSVAALYNPVGQTGGKSRRHKCSKRCKKHHRRSKRGGTWAAMMGQAAVPFGLLATQRYTASRGKRSKTTKKQRRR
jgi:hypothetical protein